MCMSNECGEEYDFSLNRVEQPYFFPLQHTLSTLLHNATYVISTSYTILLGPPYPSH
jgi:hypothetical protein